MDEPQIPSAPQPPSQVSWPFRWAWQVFVALAGIVTIIVGVILLPLPGPGSVVIVAGIGILATEFIWAKQLMTRIRIWVKQQLRRWKNWKKPDAK
ncbi:MAG: hypothetical protein JWN70_1965 [Planctomycetaceae bacterium]|nr:hypothetical protein [Planctomycetaceae bacterium]